MTSVKYDLVFADPPFDLPKLDDLPDLIIPHLIDSESLFILEHGPKKDFSDHPKHIETRRYGKVHFSFFGI